jgi:hypothetical protein
MLLCEHPPAEQEHMFLWAHPDSLRGQITMRYIPL